MQTVQYLKVCLLGFKLRNALGKKRKSKTVSCCLLFSERIKKHPGVSFWSGSLMTGSLKVLLMFLQRYCTSDFWIPLGALSFCARPLIVRFCKEKSCGFASRSPAVARPDSASLKRGWPPINMFLYGKLQMAEMLQQQRAAF